MRQLIIILWICFSGVGLMSCSVQNINRDVASWYPYKIIIDGVDVSFKLPPGGKIGRRPPPARVDTRNIDEVEGYYTLFSVNYDSGPYSYSPSEFNFFCNLVRHTKLPERKKTMKDIIRDAVETWKQTNEINEINTPGTGKYVTISSEVVTINERKWLNDYIGRQYDHARLRPKVEGYDTLFSNTHYFSCVARYGYKIVKNEEWLADRRKLLKEIISTITIKQ